MDSKILGMDSKRVGMDEQSNYSLGNQNNNIHHLLFPKKSWSQEEDKLLERLVEKFSRGSRTFYGLLLFQRQKNCICYI